MIKKQWSNVSVQRQFLEEIAKNLNVKKFDDWYKVRRVDIIDNGGLGLLDFHSGSHIEAICTIFNEHNFQRWKFNQVTRDYWKDVNNHRHLFDYVAKELELKSWEDWYTVEKLDVEDVSPEATTLLRQFYDNSLAVALLKIFPHFNWKIWLFRNIPSSALNEIKIQRNLMEEIGKKFKITNLSDWYRVTIADFIHERGGKIMLNLYETNNLIPIITTVFPEYNWRPWKFEKVTEGFWKDFSNHRRFFESTAIELNIKKLEQWNTIKYFDIVQLGGNGLLSYYRSSLLEALRTVYPEHDWGKYEPVYQKSQVKSQTRLHQVVIDIWPSVSDIHLNYLHPNMQFSDSLRNAELDIYIPSLAVAFEYQGEQHYMKKYIYGGTLSEIQKRDLFKKEECKRLNITLIYVPYWWDGTKESLAATIAQFRPDLMKEQSYVLGKPIADGNLGIPSRSSKISQKENILFGLTMTMTRK